MIEQFNILDSTTSGSMSIPSSRSSAMGGVGGLFAAGIPKLNKPGGHSNLF